MISEEERNAIDDLFHLQHINTYLDLSKDNFQIKSKTIIDWSKSTETVLNLLQTQNKMIELMAEEMKTKEYEYEDMCLYSEDCHGEYCEKCIIEYFRNKAKESE